MSFFKRNSNPSYLAVFDLQGDWDATIREAAIVLVQLCAPRDAFRHFYKIKKESHALRLNTLLSKLGPLQKHNLSMHHQIIKNLNEDLSLLEGIGGREMGGNSSMLIGEGKDNLEDTGQTVAPQTATTLTRRGQLPTSYNTTEKFIRGQVGNHFLSSGSNTCSFMSNEAEDSYDESEYLFIDKYADEQIKEIVSIFRNDFKPPKNLWIEKYIGTFADSWVTGSLTNRHLRR